MPYLFSPSPSKRLTISALGVILPFNNTVLLIGKTFGHLYRSAFFEEIYSITDGPPPEINLTNEKNNGNSILKLIENDLVKSAHDISVGGLIVGLAEMTMGSKCGVIINKPKRLTNLFEYFFGEDQGRDLIEIESSKLKDVQKILKENNVFNEIVGVLQKDYFEIPDVLKININDLYNINNKWYDNY